MLLLCATAVGCNKTAAITLMVFGVGTEGLVGAGYYANNLDVAGRFAGIVNGHLTDSCGWVGLGQGSGSDGLGRKKSAQRKTGCALILVFLCTQVSLSAFPTCSAV